MTVLRCPTCGESFERCESTAMPFCSERCRLIDLGRWADERHSVPVPRDIDQDDEASATDSPGFETE